MDGTDEEQKQEVDAAAPTAEAESYQVKDGEDMEMEMDASTIESADLAKSSQGWILLDQVDEEVEGLGMEEDKSTPVIHEDSSATEGKEEPETVTCDAFGSTEEKAPNDGEERIKGMVEEESRATDGVESCDNTKVDTKLVTGKSYKKEADVDNVLSKETDETAVTHKEETGGEHCTVDDMDVKSKKCDAVQELKVDVEKKELSESGLEKAELTENHEKVTFESDISSDGSCFSAVKEETVYTISKEAEVAESNEQDEHAGKSNETEEADKAKDSKDQGL